MIGIALTALGWGRHVLSLIITLIQALIKFVFEKPWVAATIVLLVISAVLMYTNGNLHSDLQDANTKISTQNEYIVKQDKLLKSYVVALDKEKQNLIETISIHNNEVNTLKITADKALAGAKKAGLEAAKTQVHYIDLVNKYSSVNPSDTNADRRIAREQITTDQFIDDWKKIK